MSLVTRRKCRIWGWSLFYWKDSYMLYSLGESWKQPPHVHSFHIDCDVEIVQNTEFDWGPKLFHLGQVIQTHCRQVVVPFQAAGGFWRLHMQWSSFMFQLWTSWKWETWPKHCFGTQKCLNVWGCCGRESNRLFILFPTLNWKTCLSINMGIVRGNEGVTPFQRRWWSPSVFTLKLLTKD